jgi:hypothetical protein
MLTAGDSSRAGTGNMCVRIADFEAVDKPRRFGDLEFMVDCIAL